MSVPKPVTIVHENAGLESVVPATAVPTWEKAGWKVKPEPAPAAPESPDTPAEADIPPVDASADPDVSARIAAKKTGK